MADVETFAAQNNMRDIIELLRKGALVAQSPYMIDRIVELTEDERESLRNEVTHRWRHPKILYFTIILNSIAAAIQGWDQTGSNGANLSFPDDFGIGFTKPGPCVAQGDCDKNSWIVGFINSCPYLAICFL
jgi:hypothetical protein